MNPLIDALIPPKSKHVISPYDVSRGPRGDEPHSVAMFGVLGLFSVAPPSFGHWVVVGLNVTSIIGVDYLNSYLNIEVFKKKSSLIFFRSTNQ